MFIAAALLTRGILSLHSLKKAFFNWLLFFGIYLYVAGIIEHADSHPVNHRSFESSRTNGARMLFTSELVISFAIRHRHFAA